jgi:cytochrome c peroxidase
MTIRRSLPLVAALVMAAGCSKKENEAPPPTASPPATAEPAPAAPAAAPAAPAAPAVRPSQQTLPTVPALELPDDPKRKEKIALGHALFFEPRLSVDGSRSCYSCHKNEDGNGGHEPKAIGAKNAQLTRHSPVIWNVAYFKNSFYWDGRSPTLEAQAKAAWAGGNMGVGKDNLEAKAAEIGAIAGYKKLFAAAFPGQAPSADLIASALAEYERTLLCTDTAYDRYAAGDKTALSEGQQRGLDVFMGKGQCTACHAPPFFSSAMGVEGGVYFNVGVGTQGKAEADVDPGRLAVTNNAVDWAAFKPPSLRNVRKSAPYGHDGSLATLDEVVTFMASGGASNKNRTTLMADRALLPAEKADLIDFLGALDCPGKLAPPAKMP